MPHSGRLLYVLKTGTRFHSALSKLDGLGPVILRPWTLDNASGKWLSKHLSIGEKD